MELSIVKTEGIPEGCILSIRAGSTRRQSPLPCSTPFKLPVGPWAAGPLKIDVLCPLGKSQAGLKLKLRDVTDDVLVPIDAYDGRSMSIKMQVLDCANPRPQTAPVSVALDADGGVKGSNCSNADAENSPARRHRAELAARSYLDKHKLHEFMHTLFEQLLEERPSDPYSFIAMRFCEAAQSELPEEDNTLFTTTLLGSFRAWSPNPCMEPVKEDRDTAWGSHLPLANDEPLGDGSLQLVVRTLVGRLIRPITARPDETIASLRARIAEAESISSASAIQILWWADPCQNDLTLEEHGITSGSSIHIVQRDQALLLSQALTASSDGSLKVWDLELCEPIVSMEESRCPVLVVAVDWQGNRALSGDFNGNVRLWNIQTGVCCRTMASSHTREAVNLDVCWDKMLAVSGSRDGTARFWDMTEGQCSFVLSCESPILNVAVDWTEMRALCGCANGVVKQFGLNSGECQSTCEGPVTEEFTIMTLDCHGNMACGGLEDGRLLLWQTQEGPSTIQRTLSGHSRAVRALTVHWPTWRALSGSDDGSLSLWSLKTGECQQRFIRAHIGMVFSVFVDWSLGRVLSGSFDGSLKLWDLNSGKCVVTFPGHPRAIWSIVAS